MKVKKRKACFWGRNEITERITKNWKGHRVGGTGYAEPLFLRILANPDESASPWRWVRRLLPLVAMGVGVGLQPGSLVIFSGAAALDPHSAIIFLGLLSVSAMTVSRWPYLFLIAIAVALVGISATVQPLPWRLCCYTSVIAEGWPKQIVWSVHSGLWCRTLWIENYIGKKNFVVPCFYAAMPHVFSNVVGWPYPYSKMKTLRNSMSLQNNRRYWGSSIFWKQLPTLYTKPWRTTTNRACATTGGACTVQNSAATVASQEGYIRLIRRRFHCRVPHKHIVPIKGSYGTAWMF